MSLPERCRAIAESCFFQNTILGVILVAAILVGIETYPEAVKQYHF